MADTSEHRGWEIEDNWEQHWADDADVDSSAGTMKIFNDLLALRTLRHARQYLQRRVYDLTFRCRITDEHDYDEKEVTALHDAAMILRSVMQPTCSLWERQPKRSTGN